MEIIRFPRSWREKRRWFWRLKIPLWLLAAALIVGGAAGYVLYDLPSDRPGFPTLIAEGGELFDRLLADRAVSDRPPAGWERHYRRPPESGRPPYHGPGPGTRGQDAARQVRFRLCSASVRRNCVIDGDTIRYGEERIRIADIDAPEISGAKCASEKALGQRATHRLLALLNHGPIRLVRTGVRDRDRYGRLLRVIERDGRSLGMVLVAEGLARPWDGRRRSWC